MSAEAAAADSPCPIGCVMARISIELSDFAPLVRDVANRRQPLLATTFSHGPRLLQVQLDVTLHALEAIESAGPITVQSQVEPGASWLHFQAEVPKLMLRFPCTLKRGTMFIKDGDWPLEVSFHGRITGRIHLIGGPTVEPPAPAAARRVQVKFEHFQLRCPAFPDWLDKPLRPILERTLASIIAEMIPVELRRPFIAQMSETAVSQAVREPRRLSARDEALAPYRTGGLYWSAYYLSYGLSMPFAWLAHKLSFTTPWGAGLRDGASSASEAAEQTAERWHVSRRPSESVPLTNLP
ncbi:MAG: hypothetical protein JSS02_12660 [Planctomycetes bacterium]|nr:hypothetical protein [Planctomycetota bacterium]